MYLMGLPGHLERHADNIPNWGIKQVRDHGIAENFYADGINGVRLNPAGARFVKAFVPVEDMGSDE
jgi:hypothetical protein